MSTHARIGKLLHDGTIKHIYCHADGYIEGGVGETLVDNYTDVAKIDELLSLGNVSSLGASIHPKGEHTFENREYDVCVFYGRDRGQIEESEICSLDDLLEQKFIEYFYIYDGRNWWVKAPYSDNTEWQLVKSFLPTYILTKEDFTCNI